MADAAVSGAIWRIEYNDVSVKPMAVTIATDLREAGLTSNPTYKAPRDPTLGTREGIITILVTAAAKALIVSGWYGLDRHLQSQIDPTEGRRVHLTPTDS